MEICFADSEIVVCIKPVGLDSEKEMPEALRRELGGDIYPLHRLDKNVGGLMVYARTKKAAALLSRQISQGELVKEYVALVHGQPTESGDWEDLLWKDPQKNKVFVVKRERKGVKNARLTYRLLSGGETSLVRIRLYTGRSHQIRVQFASRGFPLVGDHKYGAKDKETAPMLFSAGLTFSYNEQVRTFHALPCWAEDDPQDTVPE